MQLLIFVITIISGPRGPAHLVSGEAMIARGSDTATPG